MPFHLNPASLVDQRGSDHQSLLLLANSNLSSPSVLQAYGNFSIDAPTNVGVPQIFVVNPTSDNVFRHVSTERAHAAIIGLIYFSMWMGALGWDIVSTVSFDVRLIRETSWSSSFSSIYSIAYLLSRYISLSWLITVVTNSVIMTNQCDAWMKGSTALFSIGISATMLVFCLRTCSIWHMKQKVVSLVVSAWFLVVAFAVLLPVMSYGSQLPTSNFCSWHFNGLYVVGLFGALLIFDLLCLVLTVCKLNKAGWRGLLRSLFPSSRHNLDAENVKTMLVQKTTAFFAIQFLFLISALLVYVLTDTYSYRMMNIVASVAVASSMAGRIFRRAWRQTRELSPHNINKPPSYFPAWAEEHREAGYSRNDVHSIYTAADDPAFGARTEAGAPKLMRINRNRDKYDSLAFYVEGEFRPQSKPRSLSNPSLRSIPRTPTSSAATQHMREMEAGHAGIDPGSDVVSIIPSTVVIARDNLTVPSNVVVGSLRRDSSTSQSGPAPAYSRRLGSSSSSSRPHTAEREASASSTFRRPNSAGGALPPRLGSHPSVSNLQARPNTAALPTRSPDSFHSQSTSPANGTASAQATLGSRDHDQNSDDQHGFIMEEKRRTFVTSPPLSAGVKLDSKRVYDVDSVKAAARFGPQHAHLHKPLLRPATASSVPPTSAFASPARGPSVAAPEPESRRRCATGGSVGSAESGSLAFLSEDPLAHHQQRTPRPKTAPDWPSPSLSASGSAASHMTLLPRDFSDEAAPSQAEPRSTHSHAVPVSNSTSAADDDALLAFLDTVERDSRDRAEPDRSGSHALVASVQTGDDARPRTSRGNTATSSSSVETDEDQKIQWSSAASGSKAVRRGRRASASSQSRSGAPSREGKASQTRALSSAGARGRPDTSDGISSSANRPSTAVGEAVKPFGFGVLASSSRRGSHTHPAVAISDDEEGEAEAELGSVIQSEYAKLAARAQMPLDPPC